MLRLKKVGAIAAIVVLVNVALALKECVRWYKRKRLSLTVRDLSPQWMQIFLMGHGSPHTLGQRWPQLSCSEQRSLQGSLVHGAPHGS